MQSPLFDLIPEHLRCVLQKMRPRSLNRLRRTNKRIDLFLEDNRNRLVCSAENDRLVFSIEISEKKDSAYYKVGRNYIEFLEHREYIRVLDPYQQLAHLRFNALKLCIDFSHEDTRQYTERIQKINRIYQNQVKPLVSEMRIQCEFFGIHTFGFPFKEHLQHIMSVVNFSSVVLLTKLNFSFLLNPLIQRCRDVRLLHAENIEEDMSTVLRYSKIPELTFIPHERPFGTELSIFLEAVRQDSNAKGSVQWLNILAYDLFAIFDGMSIVEHILTKKIRGFWPRGVEDEKFDKHFFRMKMNNGGMAVIVLYGYHCEINFIDDDSRESLFEVVAPYLLYLTPFDVSSIFDEFLEADDITGAFEKILSVFNL